jgi:hypothetical protein
MRQGLVNLGLEDIAAVSSRAFVSEFWRFRNFP